MGAARRNAAALYLSAAWAEIPRLLGAIDRNPYRPTYGCLDRQYWHYRTSSFPWEMYQEGALALAMVVRLPLPGNRWQADPRVRDLAVAALRFSARSSRADGSCDDYYPFERAMGAAVFSLQAAARAAEVLDLDDPEILAWLRRRADWLTRNQESGRLANHQALAALGLLRVAQITGQSQYRAAARKAIGRVLQWQSAEGWFEEYGGADPGYQTVTIDCLAKYRQATGDHRLDEPLRRAVDFARHFLHPDQSYGGEYGSRGSYHFYPHGMELLAAEHPAAADLADGFLGSLRTGACAHFVDDRMFAHRLANLIEAYVDWAAQRAVSPPPASLRRYFPQAQILVVRDTDVLTVVSAARGGVFKHFGAGPAISDAGLLLETDAGRLAASQWHDFGRQVTITGQYPGMADPPIRPGEGDREPLSLSVAGPLYWCRADLATPLTQSLLHAGMWLAGRYCRTLVRQLLQRPDHRPPSGPDPAGSNFFLAPPPPSREGNVEGTYPRRTTLGDWRGAAEGAGIVCRWLGPCFAGWSFPRVDGGPGRARAPCAMRCGSLTSSSYAIRGLSSAAWPSARTIRWLTWPPQGSTRIRCCVPGPT